MRALFWWAYIALLCCGVMALCGCEVTLPRYPANPEPPDLPDTQPAPLPDTADAYPATFINWHGQNFASAKVSAVLTGATFSDRWLTYNEPAPASWPIITVKVKVQAIWQSAACSTARSPLRAASLNGRSRTRRSAAPTISRTATTG